MRALSESAFSLLLEIAGNPESCEYDGPTAEDVYDESEWNSLLERRLIVGRECPACSHTDGEPVSHGALTELGRVALRMGPVRP